jgi:uncharacterized small protein (DUF1192 family)
MRDPVREGEAALDRELVRRQLVGDLAVEAEEPFGVADIDARLAQRLADVERLKARQFLGLGRDAVGDGQQDPAALAGRSRAPRGAARAVRTGVSTSSDVPRGTRARTVPVADRGSRASPRPQQAPPRLRPP